MTERLTRDEVKYVANLARLTLTEDEVDTFTAQMSAILDHVSELQSLALDDVVPMSHPLPLTNVFREDVVRPSLSREDFLSAAPHAESDMFRVPPVLGEL